jgi:hypothetical protein
MDKLSISVNNVYTTRALRYVVTNDVNKASNIVKAKAIDININEAFNAKVE